VHPDFHQDNLQKMNIIYNMKLAIMKFWEKLNNYLDWYCLKIAGKGGLDG